MNDYTRSLPHLGFDPAPGDVALTRQLARRHYQIAQEARAVLAMVGRLNLRAWQGQAGDAMRAVQATFPPALRNTASAADTLHQAASSWAGQLSGFQGEADLLERKAAQASAQQQALQTRQAALPRGSAVLTADLQTASGQVSGIHQQAQELHQRYLAAAAKTAADLGDHTSLRERTEPVRKVLEAVLAPFDIVVADHWLDALAKAAGQPAEWVKDIDEKISEISKLARAGRSPVDELIEAGNLAERTGGKIDAWDTFAPGWLRTSAGHLAEVRGGASVLSGLGLAADAGTVIWPQDAGTMGWADRAVAGTNAALITLNLALDGLPVVGEVTLAATGLYLAGDYLYHHFTPFHDVAHEVGHATAHAADGAWHSVTSAIGSWF